MKIENLLPPRIIKWAFENHLRIEAKDLRRAQWAHYDVETDLITLNTGINRAEVAEALSRRMGITVTPQEAFIGILFHEHGHWLERRRLSTIGDFEGEDFDTLRKIRGFRAEAEQRARDHAARLFWDFRLNSFDQADFHRWAATL